MKQETFQLNIDQSVNVTSPNYPQFYPDNLDLTFYFTAATLADDNADKSAATTSFAITFHEMTLVAVAEWHYDYFTIGIGGGTGGVNGKNSSTGSDGAPAPGDVGLLLRESIFMTPGTTFLIEEPSFWIRLQTGMKYRHKGFSATVSRVQYSGMVKLAMFFVSYHIIIKCRREFPKCCVIFLNCRLIVTVAWLVIRVQNRPFYNEKLSRFENVKIIVSQRQTWSKR